APPQIASITAPTSAVTLPDSVKIDVVVSDPGKADSLTVSFDWGDGKKNTVPKTKLTVRLSALPGSLTTTSILTESGRVTAEVGAVMLAICGGALATVTASAD